MKVADSLQFRKVSSQLPVSEDIGSSILTFCTFRFQVAEFKEFRHFLFEFQISTEAQGKEWSIETSSARNYVPHTISRTTSSKTSSGGGSSGIHASATYAGTANSMEDAFGMSRCVAVSLSLSHSVCFILSLSPPPLLGFSQFLSLYQSHFLSFPLSAYLALSPVCFST